MTNPTTPFDRALAQFKQDMRWSPEATETEKTLVLGNLNGFVARLNHSLMDTTDAEILAAVPMEDVAEGRRLLQAAMDWAADAIRLQDGGDPTTETGWKSDEALAHWLTIKAFAK